MHWYNQIDNQKSTNFLTMFRTRYKLKYFINLINNYKKLIGDFYA